MISAEVFQNVKAAVSECFATDQALIDQWHVASGKGLSGCIEKTMNDVATFHPQTFKFYTIYLGKNLAAYWGTEFGQYVNLLFVKPEHRNPEFMKNFWNAICESVSSPFKAAIYAKNKPAVDFYLRQGKKINDLELNGQPVVVFEFMKDKV